MPKYIHVKNLEKYHPKYKDRNLVWCKVYFTMIDGDPEFEMIDEIDKWRFLAFVILELKSKKPIPLDNVYLSRKGFDLKKRPISKTIEVLHEFIEVRNIMLHNNEATKISTENPVTHIREEKRRIDKNIVDKEKYLDFVFLTKNEHKKLIEKFGDVIANEWIGTLNEGIGSKGYKYDSHYHTILAWYRKKEKEDKKETDDKDERVW